MNEEKILIVLDDIWETLNLLELGIPTGRTHRGCKILLTSRNRDVCNQMDAFGQTTFMISPLSQEEAWSLFKEKSGYSDDMRNLSPIALQIAEECKGLPIALVVVGRALKGKSLPYWKNALSELRRSLPHNIPRVIKDVYKTLEFSYINLESEEAKSLFLMCCLYPEDFEIPIEDLMRNGMGLQMFKGTKNLEEARNRVHVLVETLKDRYLLIGADNGMVVKMHDVIRDVGVYIASEDKGTHIISYDAKELTGASGGEKYTCISIISEVTDEELSKGMNYPNLELLQIRCDRVVFQMECTRESVPIKFFEGMRKLKVLDAVDLPMTSLPSSLQFLTNLQMLQLRGSLFWRQFPILENVSIVGKLLNLEILSFRNSGIKELPKELGDLTNLRLLDLHQCTSLRNIAPGVIQNMVKLEELYMMNSFSNWEAETDAEERKNASLIELKALTNLSTLEIQVPHPEVIPNNMWSSFNLNIYSLSINYEAKGEDFMSYEIGKFQKIIHLSLPTICPLDKGMKMMLKSTEALRLRGNGAKNVMIVLAIEGFRHINYLHISDCDSAEYFGSRSDCILPNVGVFPVLEELSLFSFGNLKQIWHDQLPKGSFRELRHMKLFGLPCLKQLWRGPITSALANLKSILVEDCNNLENVLSLSTVEALPQFEELEIRDCKMLKEVFSVESRHNVSGSNKMHFTKLTTLTLHNLPSLTIFCKGIDSSEFPQLIQLTIDNIDSSCLLNRNVLFPRLKTLNLENLSSTEDIASHEIPNECFRELKELVVESCNNLRSLFPLPFVRNLTYLKKLKIISCEKMIGIISQEEKEEEQGKETKIEFPSMKQLIIDGSPNMKRFSTKFGRCFFSKVSFVRLKSLELHGLDSVEKIWCSEIQDVSFMELEGLHVKSCNKLRSLFPHSVAKCLVDLKEIRISDCEMMTEIIEKEEEEEENLNVSLFPQLKTLWLERLDNLKMFCHMKRAIELPSLDLMSIDDCSEMETFSLGAISTPKLMSIYTDESVIPTFNTNDTIQHLFYDTLLPFSTVNHDEWNH